MTINQTVTDLQQQYDVVAITDLDQWNSNYEDSQKWLETRLKEIRRDEFQANQRLIFTHSQDWFDKAGPGLIMRNLQVLLNEVDISNCFVIIVTSQMDLDPNDLCKFSSDATQVQVIVVQDQFQSHLLPAHPGSQKEIYQYGSSNPIKVGLDQLNDREKFLLTESKTFCIYPWVHLHAYPTGEAYPCCHAEMKPGRIGSCRQQTLQEIWNSKPLRQLRLDMLNETEHAACERCYEQEKSGFFSGRQSANKHHGHHIHRVHATDNEGRLEKFELTYWDIRFSNLCNLRCRSCGHIFSSQWQKDQKKLPILNYWNNVRDDSWPENPPWTKEEFEDLPESIKHELINNFGGEILLHLDNAKNLPVLYVAGRNEDDMWQQLQSHIDHVEQIYFAGGEPLLMEEHYRILDELVKRKRFDVRLLYNTNFTHTDLKGRSVFEYWKMFDSVAVGASLDAQGARAEYIRKGTDWAVVEQNRRDMLRICPDVDFYISPTLSIMNALHLPDFHRDWVEKGLLRPQDLNVNILQDPAYYRIDIANSEYKQKIQERFQRHIQWLKPQDNLSRATVGFESAINFMNATDNSHLVQEFWKRTRTLDKIRQENILDVLPELQALQ